MIWIPRPYFLNLICMKNIYYYKKSTEKKHRDQNGRELILLIFFLVSLIKLNKHKFN